MTEKVEIPFDEAWERVKQSTGWKSQGEMAEWLGIKQSSVSGAKARGAFPLEWLFRIGQGYKRSVDYLAQGEGAGSEGKGGALLDQDEFVLVPRYDVRTSCGTGALVESEQVVDHLAFKRQWVKLHGLQADCLALISAKGDSMEPTIKDGFLLLVDLRQQEIKSDGIYVLRIDNELIAKRCQKLFTGELKIQSDNQSYGEQLVPADQIDKLDIIGRVVWGGGKM